MPRKKAPDTKIYVLDTNILLHEPLAFLSFKENDVVVPMTVLEELDYIKDSKKTAKHGFIHQKQLKHCKPRFSTSKTRVYHI